MAMPVGANGTFGAPTPLDGQLTDVSASSTQVVGVNATQQIYQRSLPMGQWQQLPGAAARASVADDGTLWVVTAQDQIFRWIGNTWQPVPGALKEISVGSAAQIVGSNGSGQIYRFDAMANSWALVPAPFAAASVSVGSDGTLYAVDASDNVHRFEPMMSQWIQIPGQLKQISCHNALSVVGVNRLGHVYQLAPSTNTWSHISSLHAPIARLSVGTNGLFVVGNDASINHLPNAITTVNAAAAASAAMMGAAGGFGAMVNNMLGAMQAQTALMQQGMPPQPQPGIVVQQGMPTGPVLQHVPVVVAPSACQKCKAKGGLGTFGPCEPGNMHFKATCNVCDGTRVTVLQHQCPMCHGKGGIDTWGKPCDIVPQHMHFKQACPACAGKSYTLNQLHKCSHCTGHGWFDTWDKPCMPGSMHAKRQCAHCHGKAYN
jgi:hypothetical protein